MFNLGDLSALGSALAWSISIIFLKLSGPYIGAVALNMLKNTVTIICFAITVFLTGADFFPEVPSDHLLLLMVSGLFGITIGDVLFVSSLNRLGASLQAVVDCLYAPIMIALAFFFLGETISWQSSIGCLLVMIAVAIGIDLAGVKQVKAQNLLVGMIMGISSLIVMGIGVFIIKPILNDYSLAWVNLFRFTMGNLFLFLFSLRPKQLRGISKQLTDKRHWKYSIPASILGPFLATMLWLGGFKHTSAAKASIMNQMSTFFVVILAVIVLKEKMTKRKLSAVIIGFFGALLVNLYN